MNVLCWAHAAGISCPNRLACHPVQLLFPLLLCPHPVIAMSLLKSQGNWQPSTAVASIHHEGKTLRFSSSVLIILVIKRAGYRLAEECVICTYMGRHIKKHKTQRKRQKTEVYVITWWSKAIVAWDFQSQGRVNQIREGSGGNQLGIKGSLMMPSLCSVFSTTMYHAEAFWDLTHHCL